MYQLYVVIKPEQPCMTIHTHAHSYVLNYIKYLILYQCKPYHHAELTLLGGGCSIGGVLLARPPLIVVSLLRPHLVCFISSIAIISHTSYITL